MISVNVDGPLVVIGLPGNRRNLVVLDIDAAEEAAFHLNKCAGEAELNKLAMDAAGIVMPVLGESWGLKVDVHGINVVILLNQFAERIPLPAKIAQQLAKLLQMNAANARHRLKIVLKQG